MSRTTPITDAEQLVLILAAERRSYENGNKEIPKGIASEFDAAVDRLIDEGGYGAKVKT